LNVSIFDIFANIESKIIISILNRTLQCSKMNHDLKCYERRA